MPHLWRMTKPNANFKEENKNSEDTKPRIYEATKKDWDDFFAVQEDLDTLFDRWHPVLQ